VLNRSHLGIKIPRAILKFGIFAWQFWGCIGMLRRFGMIRKSVKRFSDKIMPEQEAKARWRFIRKSSRFSGIASPVG
jgi:hypothetical protein